MTFPTRTFALALLIAGCASADVAGTYESTLPAASGGAERQIGITLERDGTATVTSAFSGLPSRFQSKGNWRSSRAGDEVIVSLAGPRPEEMVFRAEGDQLVAKWWDRAIWGEAGPGTLRRR